MNRHVSSEKLSAYMDKALSERERREVDDHLLRCEACGREVERLERITGLLRRRADYAVPPFFAERLAATLKARRERSVLAEFIWVAKRLVPGFAIAVAAVLWWSASQTSNDFNMEAGYFAATDSTTVMALLAENEQELTADEVLQLAVFESSIAE